MAVSVSPPLPSAQDQPSTETGVGKTSHAGPRVDHFKLDNGCKKCPGQDGQISGLRDGDTSKEKKFFGLF